MQISMLTTIFASCMLSLASPSISLALPYCHVSQLNKPLFKLAAYYGATDNRSLISEGGKKLGLSDVEIAQMREITGIMVCPGPNGMGFSTSASLEGTGDRILTAAHALDQNAAKSIQFDKCYFQNESVPPKIALLSVNSNHLPDAKFNAGWPQDHTADYAVIKLQKSLAIKNPFPIDFSGRHLNPEDKILVVSGAQKGFDNGHGSEPIVQQCHAPNSSSVSTTLYFTDCALFPKGSGSIGYFRDEKGILNQKMIASGNNTDDQHEEYDFSKKQYSVFLGLDGSFLADAPKLGLKGLNRQVSR